MKKIVCLIVALVILSTTAFAAGDVESFKNILYANTVYSGAGNSKLSVTFNKPLEIFDYIPEASEETEIDFNSMLEGLSNASFEMNYSMNMSSDAKQMKLAAEFITDTPIVLNDSLKISAWAKFGVWMDYDFTDAENPAFKMFFKMPFYRNYVGVDMSEYFAEHPEDIAEFEEMFSKELRQKAFEAYEDNANIKRSGNTYTVTFDSDSAEQYILDILSVSQEVAAESDDSKTVDEIYAGIAEFFEKNDIFADDAITLKVKVDSKNNITMQDMKIHFAFNVYDMLVANEMSTTGLEREGAYIDFTVNSTDTIDRSVKEVVFPELTEENSEMEIFDNDMYISDSAYFTVYEMPLFENESMYFSAEETLNGCGIDMSTDNNSVNIFHDGADQVISFEVGSDKIYVSGQEIKYDYPVCIEKDGKLYLDTFFLEELGINIYGGYDIEENAFYYTVSYYYPEAIMPEVEEIPEILNYGFVIERFPYIKDNVYYIPAYEFFASLYDGQFSFDNGLMTYTADKANDLGIYTMSVKDGDRFVSVNGEQKEISVPVENVGGVLNIPMNFATQLGLTADTYMYTTYDTVVVHYDFSMKNPDYQEPQIEDEPEEDISTRLWYWVSTDTVPYVEDGVVYMPVYEFVETLFIGEFKFAEGYIEYSTAKENEFGITTISAKEGDGFVTVDGKMIAIDGTVKNVDGILRIPVSFSEKIGLRLIDASYAPYGTSYHFEKTDSAETNLFEYSPVIDHWFTNIFGF